ncbi:MAG TPA: hypothetical protein VHJ38_17575 [Nitrososphaeraceae archaeon]|nr:hypothetical protein [Nitrososphaeraceae archaeon]
MKNIGENEVKNYPLVSLKDEELKLIFNLLDPTTLNYINKGFDENSTI